MTDRERYLQLRRAKEEIMSSRLREIDDEMKAIMRRQTTMCMTCGRKGFEEDMHVLDAEDVHFVHADNLQAGDRVCFLGCD